MSAYHVPASILGAWHMEESKTRFLPSRNLYSGGEGGGETDTKRSEALMSSLIRELLSSNFVPKTLPGLVLRILPSRIV